MVEPPAPGPAAPDPPPGPLTAGSETLSAVELRDAFPLLSPQERADGLRALSLSAAQSVFLGVSPFDQASLLSVLSTDERRVWLRLLPPDDAADVIQHSAEADRPALLALLDEATRREVSALLAYAEDDAGGLMNPRFVRVRPEMTLDEAIAYIRRQAREKPATMYYVYVLDKDQRLLGAVSLRELFTGRGGAQVSEVMRKAIVRVSPETDQEEVSRLFAEHDLLAMPVCDVEGRMQGVVTVDDVVDVVREEAAEDIQKLGGGEALGAPYFATGFARMLKKRAGWLSALFLGEMLTATAMGHFEDEIARAVVLALFVPLIISSGGNSGSQATTIVISAMSVGEVRLRDWFRVMRRELAGGVALGAVLGAIGIVRIAVWQLFFHTYGPHAGVIALTVGLSLVGVVTFGTLAGSMLPFLLRRLGFDPASASAPFVATLVDVTGLVIYFTVASVILGGTLL